MYLNAVKQCFDHSEEGVAVIGERGTVYYVNPGGKILLAGFPDAEDVLSKISASKTKEKVFLISMAGSEETVICKRIGTGLHNDERVGLYSIFKESELKSVFPGLTFSLEQKEHFQDILNCIYNQVYVLDHEANVLMVNDAVLQRDYRQKEHIIGRNMKDLVDEGFCEDSLGLKILRSRKAEGLIFRESEGYELLSWGIPHFKNGEIDFIVCTEWDMENLIHIQNLLYDKQEQKHLRPELAYYRTKSVTGDEIIAESTEMKRVLQLAGKLSRSDATVLIQGESGTGKELVMKYICNNSQRANAPLIEVNCGAIPENLIESQLFGYEKGAFTNADSKGKPGLFEAAQKGTIFLDEVGELPYSAQSKLLRVLQEKEIYRVGGIIALPVDVRVIAATNVDLKQSVESKHFREDLYYRLNVLPIYIPPLRERAEDIPMLLAHFMSKYNVKYKRDQKVDKRDYDLFLNYSWPGNVRELQNVVERAFLISTDEVLPRSLWMQQIVHGGEDKIRGEEVKRRQNKQQVRLKQQIEEYEKGLLLEHMPQYENSRQFADLLGTDKTTINRKLRKYGIKR